MAGIVGLAGQPRSGKSYTSIELFVLPALKERRHIVTNLPLKMDAINRDFPGASIQYIENIEKQDWSEIGKGCLLILDEVWRLWPQGKTMKGIPEAQLALLKEHGHRSDESGRSMDIVLISQDMGDICASVRKLIESSIVTVKHLDLGKENAAIRYYCRKAATLEDDNRPPRNQIIKSENIVYKSDIYQYYKTHLHAIGNAAPVETRMVKTSWFGSWQFRAGVALFVCMLVYIAWGVKETAEYLEQDIAPTKPVGSVASAAVPTAVVGGAEKLGVSKPTRAYSGKWRIGGYINNPANTKMKPVFLVVSQSKAQRRIYADTCKPEGPEIYCEVDGEIVTWFSGRESVGYLAGNEKPADVEKQPVPVQQQEGG